MRSAYIPVLRHMAAHISNSEGILGLARITYLPTLGMYRCHSTNL